METPAKFIVLIGTCTLMGCICMKAQTTRILKQATYVLDSVARTDTGWAPPKEVPKSANMTMHLEVIVVPVGGYDLRGWVKTDSGDKHTNLPINSGKVDHDGNPQSITWQSNIMGQPNWSWMFFFKGGGRLEVMDTGHHVNYYFHQQK